jgi:hypothetical protein
MHGARGRLAWQVPRHHLPSAESWYMLQLETGAALHNTHIQWGVDLWLIKLGS